MPYLFNTQRKTYVKNKDGNMNLTPSEIEEFGKIVPKEDKANFKLMDLYDESIEYKPLVGSTKTGKYVIVKSEDPEKADSIENVTDEAEIAKLKKAGSSVFDSYNEAVQARGQIASIDMNKNIRKEKFEQIPSGLRLGGLLALPSIYNKWEQGEEPGVTDIAIDAALAGSMLVPGGQTMRALPVAGKLATSLERGMLATKTPVLKYVLPKIATVPAKLAGEGLLATGAEGLTSIAQERDFNPVNALIGTGLGTAAAGILPAERTRIKALEAMKSVPGSELDKRFGANVFGGSVFEKIKPGEKVSNIAENEIEKVLKGIIGNKKIDFSDPKIVEALKKRVKNIIINNGGKYDPSLDAVESVVNTFVDQRTKYGSRTMARLPALKDGADDKVISAIRRSGPVAVADVLKPDESRYLTELGRLKSFETAAPEAALIEKLPIIPAIFGVGGKTIASGARGGRTYLPTIKVLGKDDEQQQAQMLGQGGSMPIKIVPVTKQWRSVAEME